MGKAKRLSNIELLRIISMLFIVVSHFFTHGNVFSVVTGGVNYYIAVFMKILAYVFTNTYILISGYFLTDSKFKFSRLIKIMVQMSFWSVVVYLAFVLSGQVSFSFVEFIKSALPFLSRDLWFATVYIGLYILSPFLNVLIENLSPKQHIAFICVLFVMCSVNQISYVMAIGAGTGLFWFVCLYFIGSFIKKYPEVFASTKLCVLLLVSGVALMNVAYYANEYIGALSITVFSNSAIWTVMASLGIFLLFLKLETGGGIYQQNNYTDILCELWSLFDTRQSSYERAFVDEAFRSSKAIHASVWIFDSVCIGSHNISCVRSG